MKLLSDYSVANFAAANKVGMKIAEGIKQGLKKSRAIDKSIGKAAKRNPFMMNESTAKLMKKVGGKLKNAKTPAVGKLERGSLSDGLTNVRQRQAAGMKR